MVRSSGRCVLCSFARDCDSSKGIQFRGFSLEEVGDGWLELVKRVFRSLLVHDPGSLEGICEGLAEVALCMGQLGFRYISLSIRKDIDGGISLLGGLHSNLVWDEGLVEMAGLPRSSPC